jgi:hypothetical protein
MEITVMVIITVVPPVTALGRGIGVLLQIISYQLVIGRAKICGLRVVVAKVAQEDEDAKVYLGDHALLFVNPVPVVSHRVSHRVSLADLTPLLVSLAPVVVSLPVSLAPVVVILPVSLAPVVVILAENNYI